MPIIVAINKMDKPDADPDRVRKELLSTRSWSKSLGGETQDVQVSALKKHGLDKLEEAILLQAEILDLRANPHRGPRAPSSKAGSTAAAARWPPCWCRTARLNQGDIVVAGAEWGRVRAMLDDKGSR